MMKDSAADTGIMAEEEDDPMWSKYRDIQYLDTEFGMVNNFVSTDNVMDSKYDITIKFRDADLEKSLSTPLSVGAEMEVTFSVFFMNGEALVSEISFDFDTEYNVKDDSGNKTEKKLSLEDFRQIEAFYTSLLGKYNDRLDFGWSKTKFVYDILFPNVD